MQQSQMIVNRAERLLECTWRPEWAAQAREAAAEFLLDLRSPPPAAIVQILLLLVSELVTNGLRHGGGVSAMSLRADRRSIQVIVADPSPAHPQDRTPDLTGHTGGFGWPMLQRLADSVRVEPQPGWSKAITAILAR
ncbi:ATP-binding protein [Streptomyces sp. NPDC051211]|uniref:ATP-binding protein n=1 Tax=Streptomyces sp. NPDC051211 TaxID=3154643 RepID=UPI0034510EA8